MGGLIVTVIGLAILITYVIVDNILSKKKEKIAEQISVERILQTLSDIFYWSGFVFAAVWIALNWNTRGIEDTIWLMLICAGAIFSGIVTSALFRVISNTAKNIREINEKK